MCLAIPGKIISINKEGDQAVVNFEGIEKEVNIDLVRTAKAGEYLIVHAGFAIQKLSAKDAKDVLKLSQEMHTDSCDCTEDK